VKFILGEMFSFVPRKYISVGLNRKSTIYEMSWQKSLIELGSSLVSISPYGGPIGKY